MNTSEHPKPKKCIFCGSVIDTELGIGRRDECPTCGKDLHSCLQCIFYDEAYANSCREPQAEPVYEKDRSNFCDYFKFGRDEAEAEELKFRQKAQLEALFKKVGPKT